MLYLLYYGSVNCDLRSSKHRTSRRDHTLRMFVPHCVIRRVDLFLTKIHQLKMPIQITITYIQCSTWRGTEYPN